MSSATQAGDRLQFANTPFGKWKKVHTKRVGQGLRSGGLPPTHLQLDLHHLLLDVPVPASMYLLEWRQAKVRNLAEPYQMQAGEDQSQPLLSLTVDGGNLLQIKRFPMDPNVAGVIPLLKVPIPMAVMANPELRKSPLAGMMVLLRRKHKAGVMEPKLPLAGEVVAVGIVESGVTLQKCEKMALEVPLGTMTTEIGKKHREDGVKQHQHRVVIGMMLNIPMVQPKVGVENFRNPHVAMVEQEA